MDETRHGEVWKATLADPAFEIVLPKADADEEVRRVGGASKVTRTSGALYDNPMCCIRPPAHPLK